MSNFYGSMFGGKDDKLGKRADEIIALSDKLSEAAWDMMADEIEANTEDGQDRMRIGTLMAAISTLYARSMMAAAATGDRSIAQLVVNFQVAYEPILAKVKEVAERKG